MEVQTDGIFRKEEGEESLLIEKRIYYEKSKDIFKFNVIIKYAVKYEYP